MWEQKNLNPLKSLDDKTWVFQPIPSTSWRHLSRWNHGGIFHHYSKLMPRFETDLFKYLLNCMRSHLNNRVWLFNVNAEADALWLTLVRTSGRPIKCNFKYHRCEEQKSNFVSWRLSRKRPADSFWTPEKQTWNTEINPKCFSFGCFSFEDVHPWCWWDGLWPLLVEQMLDEGITWQMQSSTSIILICHFSNYLTF